jgi:disulfide oxidoreductase YuzD
VCNFVYEYVSIFADRPNNHENQTLAEVVCTTSKCYRFIFMLLNDDVSAAEVIKRRTGC